jgi:hypothetical protein
VKILHIIPFTLYFYVAYYTKINFVFRLGSHSHNLLLWICKYRLSNPKLKILTLNCSKIWTFLSTENVTSGKFSIWPPVKGHNQNTIWNYLQAMCIRCIWNKWISCLDVGLIPPNISFLTCKYSKSSPNLKSKTLVPSFSGHGYRSSICLCGCCSH